MKESPIQRNDLNLKSLPKGTLVFCGECGEPTEIGVDILLAENEILLCGKCSGHPLPHNL